MIFAWYDTVTPNGYLIRAISRKGGLYPPFEGFKIEKAELLARKWWDKYGDVIWLGNNPWSNADFRTAVESYEEQHGCKFNGYVPETKKAW